MESKDFKSMMLAALEQVEKLEARDDEKNFRFAVSQYYQFDEFRRLGTETQRVKKRLIEALLPLCGKKNIKDFTVEDCIELCLEKSNNGTPEAARHRMKVLRGVFGYCVLRGWLTQSPCSPHNEKIKAYTRALDRGPGHRTWTDEEMDSFRRYWHVGTMPRLALELMYYTGARISDAAILGPRHIRGERLVWWERKGLILEESSGQKLERNKFGKQEANVPFHPELQRVITQTRTGRETFIVSTYHLPFRSAKSISKWFVRQIEKAGLPVTKKKPKPILGLSAHGIRKYSATQGALNGATTTELMGFMNWLSYDQAETYTRSANRSTLADNAAGKMFRGTNVEHLNNSKHSANADKVEAAPELREPFVSKGIHETVEAAVEPRKVKKNKAL